MRGSLGTSSTQAGGARKARGHTPSLFVRTVCRYLGCGKYSWTGWAVVCIFILFSAITIRLLVIRRARQQLDNNTLQASASASKMSDEESSRERFQVAEGHTLSVLTGGNDSSDYLFLLVHGASREFQNAEHWKPHMDFFARLGRVYAVDLLGHGHSTPGPSDALQNPVSSEAQVRALWKLIAEKKKDQQKLVLVGRSYGGRIVMNLANTLGADQVHKIILIAPALMDDQVQGLKKEVLALPTLVFWAGDDTAVPYHRVKDLLDYFGDREVVLFEHVVSEGRQAWEAHTPELIKVEDFQNTVEAWLS